MQKISLRLVGTMSIACCITITGGGCGKGTANVKASSTAIASTTSGLTGGEAPPVNDGPFGLRMGMPKSELIKEFAAHETQDSKYLLRTTMVPRPNQAFEAYQLLVSPTQGLCKIVAIGKTISNDAYGSDITSEFHSLEAALDGKYGKHGKDKAVDGARGSIWSDGNEWMMALTQHERMLTTLWDSSDRATFPRDLDGVALEAKGMSSSSGYVMLTYMFANADKCVDEITRADNASL